MYLFQIILVCSDHFQICERSSGHDVKLHVFINNQNKGPTESREQSLAWEVNVGSVGQRIPLVVWNVKCDYSFFCLEVIYSVCHDRKSSLLLYTIAGNMI
jgi:hypothetical protein